MKEIITKSAKLKQKDKATFKTYWRLVYGPDYAEEMAADGDSKPEKQACNQSACFRSGDAEGKI